MSRLVLPSLALLLIPAVLPAAAPPPSAREHSVEELAGVGKSSVVVIRIRGRDNRTAGLGSGFVIASNGLIATNAHVIGEGRALTVETADGKIYEATSIEAVDRKNDLALIRIPVKGLTPIPLGDDGRLRDGQSVVALGNPRGYKHSVVAGVVSGRRLMDGRSMIQVAIPIEPGNSGGPLLDRKGRVVGIMTMKSLVTPNLGFAVGVRSLLPLLRKPSPILMSAWLTIGALDADEWQTKGGGRWRQRAGRIIGEGGGGSGFGGRSLCLAKRDVPAVPFEVAVAVRLEDETGAAGLAFHADGGDKHYGFYPSNGKLRLVRFNGPDVFSWKVLRDQAVPAYRPGEWNTLKVRLEKGRIKCFVNDTPVFDQEEDAFTTGQIGLARFRNTTAEFKHFRAAKELPVVRRDAGLLALVQKTLAGVAPGEPLRDRLKKMPAGTPTALAALRDEAKRLEQQAAQLKQLALALHQREVLADLARLVAGKDAEFDLIHAALLIARLDNDELDVDSYRTDVERMSRKVQAGLPAKATEAQKLSALERFLFREKGFHGSRGDYYNRSNSYLSEVIDDREGLPITLSVLYMELARRLGVKVEGVGLPGHFIVRHVPRKGAGELIDVYSGGERMSRAAAAKKVTELAGRDLEDEDLAAVPRRLILVRMLRNLVNVARNENDAAAVLRYIDAIIVVHPQPGEDRLLRAVARYQAGDRKGAIEDVDWVLEHKPEGIDLEKVKKVRQFLDRTEKEGQR